MKQLEYRFATSFQCLGRNNLKEYMKSRDTMKVFVTIGEGPEDEKYALQAATEKFAKSFWDDQTEVFSNEFVYCYRTDTDKLNKVRITSKIDLNTRIHEVEEIF